MASSPNDIARATVELYLNNTPICTAEFVKPQELITAAHCIGEGDYTIKYGGNVYDITLKAINSVDYDTASFTIDDKDFHFPFIEVAPKGYEPVPGQEILSVSYPGVVDLEVITRGTFSGMIDIPFPLNGKQGYLTSMTVAPGSSGSGLYVKVNDEWLLIGIASGARTDMPFITIYSTVPGIYAVL